jgi:hypothetical protein
VQLPPKFSLSLVTDRLPVEGSSAFRHLLSKPHPATWSQPVLEAISARLPSGAMVLDPFAGTGGLAALDHIHPVLVEVEPEWATQVIGNTLALPFPSGTFLWVATSPCFGNRMADHHEAKDRCKKCHGTGCDPPTAICDDQLAPAGNCKACGGSGLSRRHTYRHYLDRLPHPDSSALLQWGSEYRGFHLQAWREITRVCGRWAHLLLDISDHIRKGQVQPVTDWHQRALEGLGWLCLDRTPIAVRRQRHGANGDLRVDQEWLLEFVRVG